MTWNYDRKEYQKKYREEHKEEYLRYSSEYRKNNKDKYHALSKKWRETNHKSIKVRLEDKDRHLQRTFGITIGEYKVLFDSQNGNCAICKNPESIIDGRNGGIRNLAVDHNHETGKVRGLLCTKCNTTLGFAHDNATLLQEMVWYLYKHK